MREKGLISVIIPCKNKESIKPFCLKSLHDQTYPKIQLIIKEGLKVNENRNNGFKETTGEYVFFLDNDVDLDIDAFSDMVKALEENPDCDFAYGHFFKLGSIFGLQASIPWNYEMLKKQNFVSTMSLIRADKFLGFDEELPRFHDWDLWLRMAENGSRGIFIPKILFKALYEPGGISTDKENYEAYRKLIFDKHKLTYVNG